MHAFEGHISPNTIKLKGFIKSQAVSILVDSGSTHNFMQSEVAINFKILILAVSPFNVSTGSGEKLVCDKVCKYVELKIQGERVTMDLF